MINFDERYKVYLDITAQSEWVWDDDTNATWTRVYPEMSPFQWARYEREYFHRHKWGEITFRNKPYISDDTYNTIANLSITQEVRIKIVNTAGTIRGYFGANDCNFDEDRKVFTIEPAILDKYTDLLENNETKIDVNGDLDVYKCRWYLGDQTLPIVASHKVPLDVITTNFNEAQNQSQTGIPNGTGSIISNTKSEYNLSITGTIAASIAIASGAEVSYYLREYNNLNDIVQEIIIGTFTYTAGISDLSFPVSVNIDVSQYSNISIDCDIPTSGSIYYNNANISAFISTQVAGTSDITVDLLAESMTTIQVWTEVVHGRSSPKEKEWDDTNGVTDYFDAITGEPLLDGRFADNDFGPDAGAGAEVTNNKDLINETLESLRLGDIQTALGQYEYEVSAVTVYEGSTYRQWKPFGTKRRRVYATCSFSREEYMKPDVYTGVDPDHPPGDGWVPTDYFENGQRLWIRKPFNGVITDWDLGSLDSSKGSTTGFDWNEKQTSVKVYPPREDLPNEISTARDLRDIIKYLYNNTADSLRNKDVYSTFLWNDLESELAIYDSLTTGTNYVSYRLPNELNRIDCVPTKDFDTSDSDITKADRVLELSFKDMMDDLKRLIPGVYWFIDDNGDLRIEHIKYLDLTQSSNDVRSQKSVDETLKFDYDKTEMFGTITKTMINADYPDFVDNKLEFEKIVSNKRNRDSVSEVTTEYLTTDVKYCIESAANLDTNGLCLIAYDENNAMTSAYAPILGQIIENGDLALSVLLDRYGSYEGVWLTGKINGVDVNFDRSARTKIGRPIELKGLYDRDGSGDEIKFITTDLGVGFVKSMTLDLDRTITEDVVLMYRFDESTQGDNIKSATISDAFELIVSDDVLFDFGNY